MERIGIYGGSFNPPHIGHIQGAIHAMDALGLDKLLLVPARVAPHKHLAEGSPMPGQRLDMVRLAMTHTGDPRFRATDLELNRDGPSYTCQTVDQIREQYPTAELYLLMGTDMFLTFETWKDPDRIIREATLAVLYRGEPGERERIAQCRQRMEALGARVALVDNPVLEISSTQLRRMLVFRCADPFLPRGVGDYIRENRLYGTGRDYRNLPMAELEQVVVKLLNPNRVAHVLGCRDTAVELARRWGADETDAARAGILHDITKALDGPLQLTLCGEYGILLDKFSQNNPKTLHALTGSLVAARIFGENPAVVSAIRHHTTGKADMTLLEKIIYVADYMEPNRDFPGAERLRQLAFSDLDGALKLGLEMTLALLARQGRDISPESREALAFLESR